MSYYYSKHVNNVIDADGTFIENYGLEITEDIQFTQTVRELLEMKQWVKYFSFITNPGIKLIEILNTGNDLEKLTEKIQTLIENETINKIHDILPDNITGNICLTNIRLCDNKIISDVIIDDEFLDISNIITNKLNNTKICTTVVLAYQINLLSEDVLKVIIEDLRHIKIDAEISSPRLCFYNNKCTHYPIF